MQSSPPGILDFFAGDPYKIYKPTFATGTVLGNVTGCMQTPWHSSEHSCAKSKNATVIGKGGQPNMYIYIYRDISQDSMIRLSMRKITPKNFQ